MLTLSALLSIVLQFYPGAQVEYVPVGNMAYASDCLMQSATDGVLLYCFADNKAIVMATNEKEFIN